MAQALPPYGQMVERDGSPTPAWYSYFLSLNNATGGGSAIIVSGNNFAPQAPNTVLIGPASGADAKPGFRRLEPADLISVEGQIPGIPSAVAPPAGAVGEYISNSVTGVALTTGVTANITSFLLTPGDWDLWGNFGTAPAGGASQTLIKAWISTISATDPGAPNGGAYLERGITSGEIAAQVASVGMAQLSIASGTTVFLSAAVTYSGGTMSATAFLGARRRR